MTEYILAWSTTTVGSRWELREFFPSDSDAIEWAKRQAVYIAGAPTLMSLELWRVTGHNQGQYVCSFAVKLEPEVVMYESGKDMNL